MKLTKKAIGFGFLVWLLPFIVAILLSPLKRGGDPLFETVMPVVVAGCAIVFIHFYFLHIHGGFMKEGVTLGIVWMFISLTLDLLMFAQGPMKMPVGLYMRDIGLVYVLFPILTIGCGWLLHRRNAEAEQPQLEPTAKEAQ